MEDAVVLSTESNQAKSSTVSPVNDESSVPSLIPDNEEHFVQSSRNSSPEANPTEALKDEGFEPKEESYVLYPVALDVNVEQPLETVAYNESHLSKEPTDIKSPDNWTKPCSPEIPLVQSKLASGQNRQKATLIYLGPDHAQDVQPVTTQYISIGSLNWQHGERLTLSSQNIQDNPISTVVSSSYNSENPKDKKLTSQASQSDAVTSRGGRIPRPPNAFMIFGREHRKILAMQHKDETNKMISVRLGNMWRCLPKEIKDSYYMKAKLTEFEHQRKYPDYEYNPIEARKRKNDIRLARIGNKKANCIDTSKEFSSPGNKNELPLNRKMESQAHAVHIKEAKSKSFKSQEEIYTQMHRPSSCRPIIRYAAPSSNNNCVPTRMIPPSLRYHSPYSPFNVVPYRFCHPARQLRAEVTSIPKIKPETKDNGSYLESNSAEQLQNVQNDSDSASSNVTSEQSHNEPWKSSQYTPLSMSLVNQCPCHSNIMNSGHTSFSQDHPVYYISSSNHPRPVLLQNPQGVVYPHPQLMDGSMHVQANASNLGQKQVINPIKLEKSEMTFSSKDGRFQASSNVQKMEVSVVRERLAVEDSKTSFPHFSAYPSAGGSLRPQLRHESQLFSPASDPCGPVPSLYRPRAYYYHQYGNGASLDPRDHVVSGWDHTSSYWMDNCLHNQPLTTATSSRPEIVNALSDALDTLNYETSHL